MSDNVVALRQARPCSNIPATLRRIADEIEADELGWPVTTAVLILGHTDAETSTAPDGSYGEQNYWTTFAAGPRTSTFTVRGLVASAMRNWNHDDGDA